MMFYSLLRLSISFFFFGFFTRLLELFYDIFNVQRLSTERAVNIMLYA